MLFQTWLSILIAAIAIYIAYQQYKTNLNNHKYNLYDKRFKIYMGLVKLLTQINRDGNVDDVSVQQFTRETYESYFLFGGNDNIGKYLKDILDKAIELSVINKKLSAGLPVGDERKKLSDRDAELNGWFFKQFEESRKIFSEYLTIK